MRLTQKQETFTQNLFKGMTQREAWIQAGYSSRYPLKIVDKHACDLANSGKIKGRFGELNDQVISPLIASETERREILSTVSRAPLEEIKPRDSINAIQELNKMDKVYTDSPTSIQDNRVINMYIQGGEEAKARLERIMSGKLIPKGEEDGQERADEVTGSALQE